MGCSRQRKRPQVWTGVSGRTAAGQRAQSARGTAITVTIVKEWDGNECETERNGRIYLSRGRYQWIVMVDGEVDRAYDLKREATARVNTSVASKNRA